jgi:hypothetical protein
MSKSNHILPCVKQSASMKVSDKNTRSNSKTKKTRKVGPNERTNLRYTAFPPPERATPVDRFVRRYQAGAAQANFAVAISHILGMTVLAVTTILGIPLYRALRLHKVRIWGPVATQGTSVYVEMTPSTLDAGNNNFNARPVTVMDSSISIDKPAYVSYDFPRDTPGGSWHASTLVDSTLFNFSCPTGSIIDFHFDGILNLDTTVLGFQRVLFAASVGQIYSGNMSASLTAVGINAI